jgi:hypothetical protein
MYPTLQLGKFQFRFRLVLMDIFDVNDNVVLNIDQKIQLQIRGEDDLGKIKLQELTKFKKTRKEILDFEKALSVAAKAHVNKHTQRTYKFITCVTI